MLHLCCWVIWCQRKFADACMIHCHLVLTQPNDRTCQDAVWSCVSPAEFEVVPMKSCGNKHVCCFCSGIGFIIKYAKNSSIQLCPTNNIIAGHIIVLSTCKSCKSKVPVYTRAVVAVIYEKHYLRLPHLIVLQLPIWFLALTFKAVIMIQVFWFFWW